MRNAIVLLATCTAAMTAACNSSGNETTPQDVRQADEPMEENQMQQESQIIISHDFKSDPDHAGWELLQHKWAREPASGRWNFDQRQPNAYTLSVEKGYWQSPAFAVEPHNYYKLAFQSKADGMAYWAAMFYDAEGNQLTADHNSGIYESGDWIDNEFYFQGKADAATARLWFQPVHNRMLYVRNVVLSKAADQQVLDWADRLYATLPAVDYEPPANRWERIPRTMRKLQNGEKLGIVVLGDSIGNDTGNSPVDKLIQRQYPGSRVEVITSVRGGTGCQYYAQENRVQDYVIRYKPDLVMIIAISHGHQHEPIRSVIQQIKQQCDAEIILTNGAVSQEKLMVGNYAKQHNMTVEEAAAIRAAFMEKVEKIAAEEEVEFLDLRGPWNAYMEKATQQHDMMWFMRDETHANARGRQVIARILERYFAPK